MTISRHALAALLVASALAVGACGDDDDDGGGGGTTTAAAAPTKQEFIAQADAICKAGDDAIAEEAKERFGEEEPPAEDIQTAVQEIALPNIEQQAADLRALTPPAGDEAEVTAIWDSLDQAVADAKANPGSEADAFKDVNAKAVAYGFNECGSD